MPNIGPVYLSYRVSRAMNPTTLALFSGGGLPDLVECWCCGESILMAEAEPESVVLSLVQIPDPPRVHNITLWAHATHARSRTYTKAEYDAARWSMGNGRDR